MTAADNPIVDHPGTLLSADINPGDTAISFASDPGYAPGTFILVRETSADTTRLPVYQAWQAIEQVYMVTGGSGTTRTIDRGSYQTLKVASGATSYYWSGSIHNAGLENLTVSGNPALVATTLSSAIRIAGAYDVWINGVEAMHGNYQNISVERSRNFTIANTYTHNVQRFDEGNSGGAQNIEIRNGSNDFLVVNNRISDTVVGLELQVSPIHGVIAYNYFWNPMVYSRAIFFHGSWPTQILVEGNAGDGWNITADNYWGMQSNNTMLRNRFLGSGPNAAGYVHHRDSTTRLIFNYDTQLLNFYEDVMSIPYCTYPNCFDLDKQTTNSWYEKNRFHNLFVRKYDNGSDEPTATYISEEAVYSGGGGFIGPKIKYQSMWSPSLWQSTGYDGLSPPISWTGNYPSSFFLTSKPWWWCAELPWPAIGADIDIYGNLNKIPAQRAKEGLSCTTSGGTSNISPTISLSVTPASITAGGSATFSAVASDTDGTVSNVQFYVNSNFQATDTTYPYSLSYSPTSAGSHTITAIATDNGGATGLSNSVSLTVTSVNLCGNGTIDTGEQCDGTNLNNQTCSSFGFTLGIPSCSSSCQLVTTSCTSGTGTLILGNNAIGSGGTDSGDSNSLHAVRFSTGAQGGTVQSISVYVVSPIGTSPNNQYSLALYSNSGTTPGSLITNTTNGTLTGNAWNTLPMTATLSPNTTYWLAYNTNGTASAQNNYRYSTGGTTGQATWRGGVTFGTWPSSFGTPAGSASVIPSIYLTYTPPATGGTLSSLSFLFSTDTNLSLGGKAVTISILPSGSVRGASALESQTPTATYLNNLNQITLPTTGRTPGSYDVQIKSPGALSRKQTFTLASNQTFTFTNKLISGDINNDNAINALDWSLMSPDWFQTGRPSDINGDGITNALDFTWLNRNWFLTGE
jgi:hypothetical protein